MRLLSSISEYQILLISAPAVQGPTAPSSPGGLQCLSLLGVSWPLGHTAQKDEEDMVPQSWCWFLTVSLIFTNPFPATMLKSKEPQSKLVNSKARGAGLEGIKHSEAIRCGPYSEIY